MEPDRGGQHGDQAIRPLRYGVHARTLDACPTPVPMPRYSRLRPAGSGKASVPLILLLLALAAAVGLRALAGLLAAWRLPR